MKNSPNDTLQTDFLQLDQENLILNNENSALVTELQHLQDQNSLLSSQLLSLEQQLLSYRAGYESAMAPVSDVFKQLFLQFGKPMLVIDQYGKVIHKNLAAERFFFTKIQLNGGGAFKSLLDEKSRRLLSSILHQGKNGGFNQDLLLTSAHGKAFNPWFFPLEITLPISEMAVQWTLVVANPVDSLEWSAQMLRIYLLAMDQIKEGILITDENLHIVRVNQGFSDITGYKMSEVLGRKPSILASGKRSDDLYQKMWTQLDNYGWWEGELWNRTKSGKSYPEWLQINRIWDDQSQSNFYIGIFSDISQRKIELDKLDNLAFFDQLTHLPNRQSLNNYLDNLLYRYKQNNSEFFVLFIDLDKFKEVNDNFGHAEGDLILQQASQRIISSIRDSDFAARLGGDEFVVVLQRVKSIQNAEKIANDLIQSLSGSYYVNGNSHNLSASIGISMFPEQGVTVTDLLRQADLAMYEAKKQGRNRFQLFEHSLDEKNTSLFDNKRNIEAAIADFASHIEIHYQPIVTSKHTQSEHYFECLARLKFDDKIIPPDEFIPVAEQQGLMPQLGIAIFKKICEEIKTISLDKASYTVNLSACQLEDATLLEQLDTVASGYGLDLSMFQFELTETAMMQNLSRIERLLIQLRSKGSRILLDDFGTGYASLSLLSSLPVDIIKIDKSFIENADKPKTFELVRAMVLMSKAVELQVLVEGVENSSQYERMRALGVDFYQGYWLGRPKQLTGASQS